ncbi:hypothetical protein GIB67_036510 [Kingdonia uniflora]|uniref:3-hydroxyisobutyryl-CoA hydrolase n=1 Tax=Kingdonia uniflora TaxID=39325 RepID=A0A7J7P7L2_9MAGN|nr:hypothetical protein GIB67_036510 [Kingdonia uniflora]
MQSLKKLLLLQRRPLPSLQFMPQRRPLSSLLTNGVPKDIVLVEGEATTTRVAVLNRPNALNALNHQLASRLKELYVSWEEDDEIGFVVMKGSGRAFCAGGDIVTLYHLINERKMEQCKDFFRSIYSFVYLVGTYLKPHVTLMDGVTMGGGAGISVPGTFRIATDKTVFATPETQIGFHSDAGASFYLSHLPGHLGEYLALTGEKLNGVEMIVCGLATHYSLSPRLTWIDDELVKLVTDDPSDVETLLEKNVDFASLDERSVMRRIETINNCFSRGTVEEIIDALESEITGTDDEWCTSALKRLKEASPLSLKVSLRSIREGRQQTLDQCLEREYRMSLQAISGHITRDFCEGVRARMVDKDFAPKWNPPRLDQVSKEMVDSYFAPLSLSEPELELPVKLREAFV